MIVKVPMIDILAHTPPVRSDIRCVPAYRYCFSKVPDGYNLINLTYSETEMCVLLQCELVHKNPKLKHGVENSK